MSRGREHIRSAWLSRLHGPFDTPLLQRSLSRVVRNVTLRFVPFSSRGWRRKKSRCGKRRARRAHLAGRVKWLYGARVYLAREGAEHFWDFFVYCFFWRGRENYDGNGHLDEWEVGKKCVWIVGHTSGCMRVVRWAERSMLCDDAISFCRRIHFLRHGADDLRHMEVRIVYWFAQLLYSAKIIEKLIYLR